MLNRTSFGFIAFLAAATCMAAPTRATLNCTADVSFTNGHKMHLDFLTTLDEAKGTVVQKNKKATVARTAKAEFSDESVSYTLKNEGATDDDSDYMTVVDGYTIYKNDLQVVVDFVSATRNNPTPNHLGSGTGRCSIINPVGQANFQRKAK